jgi:hypothetical protein
MRGIGMHLLYRQLYHTPTRRALPPCTYHGDEISWANEEAKSMYDYTHGYTGGWTRRRIVTYNVNSLVAALARPEGRLLKFIDKNRADVYAFQETMVDTSLQMKETKWKVSPFYRRVKALG